MASAVAAGAQAPSGAAPSPGVPGSLWSLEPLELQPALAPKERLTAPWSKVEHHLRERVARPEAALRRAASAAREVVEAAGVRVAEDGRVHVTVRVASLTAAQRALLVSRGLAVTFESALHGFLEGWVPPAAIEGLAGLDFVTSIQPTVPPITNTGSALSQGDAILKAAEARQALGVSGQGVRVGVLSDSVDGIAAAVASGDLPDDVQVLEPGQGSGEGTAMLEIVHDLAPGASLAFYGPGSSGDMITGITQLAAAGATVIVDDLTFFDQPHFEEGPIAQTVNAVAAQGVVYVTSSGNFASNTGDRGHYEALFASGGPLSPLRDAHAFAPGVPAQSIVVRPGGFPSVFLQWADPVGQAADDYDLYVTDTSGRIIASSIDPQNGDDVPFEQVTLDATGIVSPVQLLVFVDRFSGAARRLELYYADGVRNITPATAAGSIAGHANAAGAITVGTINAGDPGNDTIAGYSSQGPCDLFFPVAESRAKPDITGIDGVAVTGAAGFPNPFFGTSAAAPHIAALAALVRQANPALSAAGVKQALQSTAVDLGAAGFDFVYGAGRADALQAVTAAAMPTSTTTLTTTTITFPSSTTVPASPTTSTTTTLPPVPVPPQITSLAAQLDGDVVTLVATATDADADIVRWRAVLYDGAGAALEDSGLVDFTGGVPADASLTVGVTGLAQLPTAVGVGLVLEDAAEQTSTEARADFGQGDPGGPRIGSASFRARTLRLRGSGLVRGGTRVEINGVNLPRAAKVNRPGSRATAQGAARRLHLRPGANRVRVLVNGLRSNVFVLRR